MSEGIPQSFIDANSCGIMPEFDEAGKIHMRDKAARVPVECQAFGHMSDEWVADRVRMLRHRDLDHEAICCAARDRIMRLSLRVADLSASVEQLQEATDEVERIQKMHAEAFRLGIFHQERADKAEAELSRYKEALTASGDTKADYSGDFMFQLFQRDEDGNDYNIDITVPWTTLKLFMARIVQRACTQSDEGVES